MKNPLHSLAPLMEAGAVARPLPISPLAFGITAFAVLGLLLFLVLRLDRD